MSTNRKLEITQHLVGMMPDKLELTVALNQWWFNLRRSGGLRLTDHGFRALHDDLDLANWRFAVPDWRTTMNKQIYLELDRKMQYPYYVDKRNRCVIFFGSREAMMANLYGDLETWLKSLS